MDPIHHHFLYNESVANVELYRSKQKCRTEEDGIHSVSPLMQMPFTTAEMQNGNTSIKHTKFLVWLSG